MALIPVFIDEKVYRPIDKKPENVFKKKSPGGMGDLVATKLFLARAGHFVYATRSAQAKTTILERFLNLRILVRHSRFCLVGNRLASLDLGPKYLGFSGDKPCTSTSSPINRAAQASISLQDGASARINKSKLNGRDHTFLDLQIDL
jgi:hypothetical protein